MVSIQHEACNTYLAQAAPVISRVKKFSRLSASDGDISRNSVRESFSATNGSSSRDQMGSFEIRPYDGLLQILSTNPNAGSVVNLELVLRRQAQKPRNQT